MAAEIDDDLQLIRASPGLLFDLQQALPRLLWKRGIKGRVHQLVRLRDLDHVIKLIEPFQSEPQLLDTHLRTLLPSIVEAYLVFLHLPHAKPPTTQALALDVAASKLLYTFCKVRGEKIIIGFLNNEPKHLELILISLENFTLLNHRSENAWEKSYTLLLWLTHLMLVPFDLSTISTRAHTAEAHEHMPLHPQVPSIARRVITLGVKYLAAATREQDAAAKMLVRLVTRPDMQRLDLSAAVCSWALNRVLDPSASPSSNLHTSLGPLKYLVGMTVSVDSNIIASLVPSIYSAGQRLMNDVMLAFLSSSAVTKKLLVKLFRNIALLSLQSSYDPLVDFFESTGVLEETIEYCLQSLEDRDTPVRFAASKALSMIILRLDPEMGYEVVQAILESFKEDMPRSRLEPDFGAANALRWHGLTLTLAHALFRRSASPQQLPEILNALLLALNFEQRSAVGVSTGSNVRDAACFGIWSLSRRYTTKELLSVDTSLVGLSSYQQDMSILQLVAIQLLLSACLDPSGNIRRGSSAALQELIGRHPDQVTNGIALVQVVDYHAVGLRQRAMVDVAQNASNLDHAYREALLGALGKWRGLSSVDVISREAAAESIGLLCEPLSAQQITTTIEHLQECITNFPKSDLEQCHGSLLALSRILDTKNCRHIESNQSGSHGEDLSYLLSLWDLFVQGESLYNTRTPRAIRAELPSAVGELIASLAELSIQCESLDVSAQESTLGQIVTGLVSSSEGSVLQVLPRLLTSLSKLHSLGYTNKPVLNLSDCLAKISHDSSGMVQQGLGRVIALGATFLWSREVYDCDPATTCKILADIIRNAPLTEWRTTSLQAMDLIIQSGPLDNKILETVILALDVGLNDYTITERGDVGSLARIQAIQCVHRLWKSGKLENDSIYSNLLQANIVRLALEKMDRVRLQAAKCLGEGFESWNGILEPDISSSQYFSKLFAPLNQDTPAWKRNAILKGSISCAGAGAEGLLRASRMALVDTLAKGSADMRTDCLSILTSLLKEYLHKETETQALLELVGYLLNSLPAIIPQDSLFNWRILLSLVQKAHFKSNNMLRILAAVEVYQALAEKQSTRADTLKKLVSMWKTNPYPMVRVAVAECLFLATSDQALKSVDWNKPNQNYDLPAEVR